ncbi:Uma2 family endonuclease [Spirillospora sp. NPDC048911]|uniref:Uma2 family endonuclease n=1 Tax=Spirillospora sp. NPDC048911 TaxID=3364527 RepID=UPI00371871A0
MLLTEDQYEKLPDHVRRSIEVIDNHVVFLHSGSPEHSRVARRLADIIERSRPVDRCVEVSTDVDMHFRQRRRDVEGNWLSFRRPDVTVHRCLERGSKLTSRDALAVIEIVSPGSEHTDTVQKVAEYAREQIPVYLVVTLDEKLYVKVVREYRLDWSGLAYQLVAAHEDELELNVPFPVSAVFGELDRR